MLSPSLTQVTRAASRLHCKPAVNLRLYAKRPTYDEKGPNAGLIHSLLQSRDEEEASNNANAYKLRAFDTAVKAINNLPFQINSMSAPTLKDTVPGIGDGITRRIQEFIDNTEPQGTTAVEQQEAKKRQRAAKELQLISGIGPVKAKRLVEAGCMTLTDLRKPEFRSQLQRSSQIALDFHDHLSVRVLRREAEAVANFLQANVLGPKWEMHIVGSYRRGGSSMSDIDILLFHQSYQVPFTPSVKRHHGVRDRKTYDNMLVSLEDEIVLALTQHGVIAQSLTGGPTKWQGIARIPTDGESVSERLAGCKALNGCFKRLDISLAPIKSKGAALLAHTGDADYNRHVRQVAAKAGMLLNEHGLWENLTPSVNPDGLQEAQWTLSPSDTEAVVLQQLGLEFVEPGKRNFINLRNKKSLRKGASY